MNAQEIQSLHREFRKLEKLSNDELSELKTSLDNTVSTLTKMIPDESFSWDAKYIRIAKEIGQKFFLSDKISRILSDRKINKFVKVKEKAGEYFEHTYGKAQKAIEKSHLWAKMGSDSSVSGSQYHMLTD